MYHVDFVQQEPEIDSSQTITWRRVRTLTMQLHSIPTRGMLVDLEDGSKGLLIHYSSGGVTPGDSYLWILDENGRPVKWKMWVGILPIGGLEASWGEWKTMPTGWQVATQHEIGSYTLIISDLKAGNSWESIGFKEDPFAPLF